MLQSRLHKRDRHILNLIPKSAGPRLATSRGAAIYAVREPGAQTLLAESHFAEVMLAPAPGIRAALGSDRMQEYDAPVGTLLVHPANVEVHTVWSCTRESVIVTVRPEALLELATSELDAGHVSLAPPPLGTVDLEALHIAQLLKMELTRPEPANELWVGSLVTLFSVHLLRHYSKVKKSPPIRRSGLSARDARKVQEFLHENFTRKLSVGEIASIAGLSPFHFTRAFNKTFGQPPH
uniref:helix-turn-helix transcriptional regulator n=1 Tax=Nitratireductor luteus TaxID=2976980 RepID=UPI00223EA87B